jgi:hypothetical protein
VQWAEPDEAFEAFAARRGLPASFLTAHGIHVCPPDGEQPGWIAIPYPNLTGVWYHRYRNPDPTGTPKYWAPHGSATHLYNPSRLGPNSDVVFLTEGEIDCLVLAYLGFPAIGIPGTGSAGRFRSAWRLLFDGAKIIVVTDSDPAGREAAERLVAAFEPDGVDLCPPDGMDVNDWFLADRDGLERACREAMKT